MDTANALSAISSFAVVGALIFTALQVRVASRTRAEHAAITIVEAAQSEGWTNGLNQLHRIPEGASAEQIDALGPEAPPPLNRWAYGWKLSATWYGAASSTSGWSMTCSAGS